MSMELTQLQQFANLLKEKLDEISDELQTFDGTAEDYIFMNGKKFGLADAYYLVILELQKWRKNEI